jgi:Zn-dependent protease
MPQEYYVLQQLLRAGSGWVQATLLAGLLVVLVFRPERIRNRTLFHLACWLFALSVAIPPLLNLLFTAVGGGLFGSMAASSLVLAATTLAGPGLLGVSLLLALLSLMPGPPSPFQPPKHPLE